MGAPEGQGRSCRSWEQSAQGRGPSRHCSHQPPSVTGNKGTAPWGKLRASPHQVLKATNSAAQSPTTGLLGGLAPRPRLRGSQSEQEPPKHHRTRGRDQTLHVTAGGELPGNFQQTELVPPTTPPRPRCRLQTCPGPSLICTRATSTQCCCHSLGSGHLTTAPRADEAPSVPTVSSSPVPAG